jgi:transposase
MPPVLIPEALWPIIEELLPPPAPKPRGGRPRISDRAALSGILFVLRSGIAWEDLPPELGCGSGVTCWRRLTKLEFRAERPLDEINITGI